jgi:hypothetical protein
MENFPADSLSLLQRLAREYQQKHDDLEQALQRLEPGEISRQMKIRAEMTTDRFRAAQQSLLSGLFDDPEGTRDETLKAAAVLCLCFDEMRILFQVLLEHSVKQSEQ